MKFHAEIPVYGDTGFRGDCPSETAEAVTFFAKIRREYPDSYGIIATHIRNEGQRSFSQTMKQKMEGMTIGASDIFIPGCPTFLCEMKRRDHTKSKWQDGQQEYLLMAKEHGAFVCVALGYEAAFEAFNDWRSQ